MSEIKKINTNVRLDYFQIFDGNKYSSSFTVEEVELGVVKSREEVLREDLNSVLSELYKRRDELIACPYHTDEIMAEMAKIESDIYNINKCINNPVFYDYDKLVDVIVKLNVSQPRIDDIINKNELPEELQGMAPNINDFSNASDYQRALSIELSYLQGVENEIGNIDGLTLEQILLKYETYNNKESSGNYAKILYLCQYGFGKYKIEEVVHKGEYPMVENGKLNLVDFLGLNDVGIPFTDISLSDYLTIDVNGIEIPVTGKKLVDMDKGGLDAFVLTDPDGNYVIVAEHTNDNEVNDYIYDVGVGLSGNNNVDDLSVALKNTLGINFNIQNETVKQIVNNLLAEVDLGTKMSEDQINDFNELVNDYTDLAKSNGKKVNFVGYSLGGSLALNGAKELYETNPEVLGTITTYNGLQPAGDLEGYANMYSDLASDGTLQMYRNTCDTVSTINKYELANNYYREIDLTSDEEIQTAIQNDTSLLGPSHWTGYLIKSDSVRYSNFDLNGNYITSEEGY